MSNRSTLTAPEQNDLRDAVARACGSAVNLHYRDPLWQKLADIFDWQDVWPVINGDGYLTGEVWTACDDILHTDDMDAMIRPEDAKAGGWEINYEEGTAAMPVKVK